MSGKFLTEYAAFNEVDPKATRLIHDESSQYAAAKLHMESHLRITPPTDENLYLGHRGAMDDVPFQRVPVLQALAQPRPRILIADGTGLGKTLEAGMVMAELIQAGQGQAHPGGHAQEYADAIPKGNVDTVYDSAHSA